MANNYTEIMKIVNQGNKMGLSNTITRDNGIPLDLSSVQESYNAAVIYAATKAIAYQGQLLAAEGVVYIIVAESQGQIEIDGTTYENYLKPVGTIPGFDTADNNTLPQIKVDAEGNRTLEWVTISSIVEGDGNSVTTLVALDKSVTIADSAEEGFEGHKYTVKVNISAEEGNSLSLKDDGLYVAVPEITHPEYAIKADERTEGATSTTYHLTKDNENVDVAIVVPDAYNDTALAGRVKTIEDAVNHETTGLAAHETRLAEVEKFFVAADPDKINEALDTLIEIQKEIEADNASAEGMLSSIGANTAAIEKLNGDATTEGSVAKAVADAESRVAGAYATKQELTDHSNTMDGKLANYYTKTETDGLLNGKVDNSTLENYYTKTEAVAKTEIYTKGQIDQMLEDIEGGSTESAASVKRALDAYIQDTDTEVYGADLVTEWTAEDGTYTPDYLNSTSRIDTALANAAAAQSQADKGVADAKTANDAIAALTNGAVATNTTDITAIKSRLDTLETAKGDHETRIAGVEGRVTALEGEDAKINETLGTLQGNITTLTNEDGRLAGLIQANTDAIGTKANAADVYTKTEANAAIKAITGEVAADTTLVAMISAKADQATTYTKTEVDNLLKNLDQTEINNAIAANTAAIAALAGEGNTSTVKKNADDIAALDATLKAALENDGEGLDSIKELAVWIQDHETEVLPVINAHSAILEGIGGEGEKATVVDYVTDAIAAIPAYELPVATAEVLGGIKSAADTVNGENTIVTTNAVYVDATSNIGSVKAISTDILVQGAQELILNGGKATVTA